MNLNEEIFSRTYGIYGPDMARLFDAHVAVIGLGGVGGALALSLARAGVGHLTLIDGDIVAVLIAIVQYVVYEIEPMQLDVLISVSVINDANRHQQQLVSARQVKHTVIIGLNDLRQKINDLLQSVFVAGFGDKLDLCAFIRKKIMVSFCGFRQHFMITADQDYPIGRLDKTAANVLDCGFVKKFYVRHVFSLFRFRGIMLAYCDRFSVDDINYTIFRYYNQ